MAEVWWEPLSSVAADLGHGPYGPIMPPGPIMPGHIWP